MSGPKFYRPCIYTLILKQRLQLSIFLNRIQTNIMFLSANINKNLYLYSKEIIGTSSFYTEFLEYYMIITVYVA